MKRIPFGMCLAFILTVISCFAASQVATGTPPFSTLGGGPFDVINLGNLNFHFAVPMINKAGRGMPFAYDLSYDSSIWYPAVVNGVKTWQPAGVGNYGWRGQTEVATGYISFTSTRISCPNPDYPPALPKTLTDYVYSNYVYHDPFGVAHRFNISVDPGTCGGDSNVTGTATDGSGYTITANGLRANTVTSVSGVVISPPYNSGTGGATKTDANGNQISVSNGVFTDTLGTTVLSITGGAPNPLNFQYTGPSGTKQYTVNYTTVNIKTNFGCTGVSEYTATGVSLITSISLPGGTAYSFTYEPTQGNSGYYTGRVASVTLPTGGSISYNYPLTNNGTTNGINCTDGSAPIASGGNPSMTRTVSPGGTWTYARWQDPNSSPHWQTTITDPTGSQNQTVIDFQQDNSANKTTNFFETQHKSYQGSTNGTLLTTVIACYNTANPTPANCPTATVNAPINRRTVFVYLPDTSSSSLEAETDTQYLGNVFFPSEIDSYDYGTGGVGSLIRKAIMTYGTFGNATRLTSIQVKNSLNTLKASVTYSYDQTAVTTTSGTPNHTSVSGGRGNLTTLATQVSGSVTLYRRFTYYDTGTLNTSTDLGTANSGGPNTTTYNYNNTGTPSPSCGNSFVTSISEPLSLSRSFTWDCNGGMLTSVADESSQTSTTYYTGTNFGKSADPNFWRPYALSDQLGNPTVLTYPNATVFESAFLLNSNNSVMDHRTKSDGFGRPIIGQREQGPNAVNYDSVETDYDVVGRVSKTTMPYSAVADSLCSGACPATTISYDAIGRPQAVTDGGGGTLNYTYNWNDVLQVAGPAPIWDSEHTKQKQTEYDGLGRLTSVCEVTGATGSGACGQKNAQTGFLTKYTYDLLGNLTGVTQNAQPGSSGTQTRTYTFDMAGRILSEANPETGTVSYKYDTGDATCGSYTSAGDLVEKADAMGNVTCLNYDGLHRVTSVTYGGTGSYSANTDKKYFVYDATSASGFSLSNTKGRLAEAYTCPPSGSCTTRKTDLVFSYSARGETQDAWESTPNSGGYYHVSATYFPHGVPNALSGVPGLPTIYYGGNSDTAGLDGEGRIAKVTASSGQSPLVNSVTYNNGAQTTQPIGALTGLVLGSTTAGTGDSDSFTYDFNTGRLTNYTFSMGATPQTQTGALTWNANSTLRQLQITDQINTANSQTCTFGYDDQIRITSANCGSGWSQTFAFDPFGNLSKSGSASFLPTYTGASGTSTSPSNQYYSIPGGPNGVSNYYDANGNLTSDLIHMYTWDADGKTLSVDGSTITMIYDAMDRMIEQTRGSSHTQIVYGPRGTKIALMNGQMLVNAFIKLPGGARAVYDSAGLAYYRHSDYLGTSRLATTPSRTKYYDIAYAPYGEDYNGSGTRDQAFTGQNSDTISGSWSTNLYDFMMREYRTAHGRWISPDPAGISAANPANPQSWNRYAYVLNSPTSLVDPLGLSSLGGDNPNDVLLPAGKDTCVIGPTSCIGSAFLNGGSSSLQLGFTTSDLVAASNSFTGSAGNFTFSRAGGSENIFAEQEAVYVQQVNQSTSTPPPGDWVPAGGDFQGTGCLRQAGGDTIWCPPPLAVTVGLPPAMDGAIQAAKQAAQNAGRAGRWPQPTPQPVTVPANEPPPDLGGWDQQAIEALEKAGHGLLIILEVVPGAMIDVIFVGPLPTCGRTSSCGSGQEI